MTNRIVPCKGCGAPIIWLRTASGKSMPVDADTVRESDQIFDRRWNFAHFATCPNADHFRKRDKAKAEERKMESRAIVIDVETTGFEDPEPIEIACIEFSLAGEVGTMYLDRFKPKGPITFGAMATHHIVPEDLADCRPSSAFTLPDGIDYLIGHSIDFDWKAIGSPRIKRICTLALARSLWPEADSHALGAMIYFLTGSRLRDLIRGAHSASVDVDLTLILLGEILNRLNEERPVESFEDLWERSERARIPEIMPFGKHKGERIENVPGGYKSWLLSEPDVDPYLARALRGERP